MLFLAIYLELVGVADVISSPSALLMGVTTTCIFWLIVPLLRPS
jgi:hypothetical protein